MSRLDEIIALVLASIVAGCVGLVSQSATSAMFAGFGVWALVSNGMQARPGRRMASRQDGERERPIVKSVAAVAQVFLIFTAPTALVRPFAGIVPESWTSLARLFVLGAVLVIPFDWILGGLVDLITRASARPRGS